MGYTFVRKCIHIQIEVERRYKLVHEKEWTGETASIICKRYSTSRKTYYKWKNRYKQKGIDGLSDLSRRPHTIKYKKIGVEGINGLTPSEMFVQRLITSTMHPRTKQQSVTHVGNQKCNLSV